MESLCVALNFYPYRLDKSNYSQLKSNANPKYFGDDILFG
jgi:hypothetical protein